MNKQNNTRNILHILAVLLIVYAIFVLVLPHLCNEHHYLRNTLDAGITVDVNRGGTITHYDNNFFEVVNRGDVVTANIPLPESSDILSPSLCFYINHCCFELYHRDALLYRYGYEIDEKGRQVGSTYAFIPIPEEAWGDSLTLICHVTENGGFSRLDNFTILPTNETSKYVLVDHLAEFILFLVLGTLSFMMLVHAILPFGGYRKETWQIVCIAVFTLSVSLWILSYYGLTRLFLDNREVAGDLEYVTLFSLPIPLCAYFSLIEENRIIKRLVGGYSILVAAFFALCTVLHYTTVRYHYCVNITYFHIIIGTGGITLLIICLLDAQGKNIVKRIMKYGFSALLVTMLIDTLCYNLSKYTSANSALLSRLYTPLGVLIFIFALVTSFIIRLQENMISQKEKDDLTKLAYSDSLTGLANRAECNRVMDDLRNRPGTDYSITIFDLNYLKKINDTYGHEAGDMYIKSVATAIQSSFGKGGVCGRIGGDEFIAILSDKACRLTEDYTRLFHQHMQQINEMNLLPLSVSVAQGTAVSNERSPLNVDQAVKIADERMYADKKAQKAGRE